MSEAAGGIEFGRVAAERLDDAARRRLAVLAHAALPQLYDLLPGPPPRVLDLVGAQIGLEGTETENCWCASAAGEPLALLSALPAAALPDAQRAGVFDIARKLAPREAERFMAALASYRTGIEPVGTEGIYLARLGAAARPDAVGAGRRLLLHVLDVCGAGRVTLHVHRDNAEAAWLYRKAGFRFAAGAGPVFRAMVCDR